MPAGDLSVVTDVPSYSPKSYAREDLYLIRAWFYDQEMNEPAMSVMAFSPQDTQIVDLVDDLLEAAGACDFDFWTLSQPTGEPGTRRVPLGIPAAPQEWQHFDSPLSSQERTMATQGAGEATAAQLIGPGDQAWLLCGPKDEHRLRLQFDRLDSDHDEVVQAREYLSDTAWECTYSVVLSAYDAVTYSLAE
jgi:hypothetical protein